MSKLDKQFKEEFDNELREGAYAFRKVGFRILAAILIITFTIIGTSYNYRDTSLYKTVKGAYFLTCVSDYGTGYIKVIDEVEAKEYLMYNNYKKYAEMFGELEEA